MRFPVTLCWVLTVLFGTCCHGKAVPSTLRGLSSTTPAPTTTPAPAPATSGIGAKSDTPIVDDTSSESRENVIYTSKKDSNGYLIPDNVDEADHKEYTLAKHVCRRLKVIHTPSERKVQVKLELGYKKNIIGTIDTSTNDCGGITRLEDTSRDLQLQYFVSTECFDNSHNKIIMELCHGIQTYKQVEGVQEPTGTINEGCSEIIIGSKVND